MCFEESLICHASPTLANIKIANLYSFRFKSLGECLETINNFNMIMNRKGIYIELLKNTEDFYLIFVYRKTCLQRVLNEVSIQNFLSEYGYSTEYGLDEKLDILKDRLSTATEFPHEIGVFLGYPLNDVKSFIETKGQDCVFSGEWKVYHDEKSAKCLFCKYKHCKEIYKKVYKEGRQFCDMLVGA